MSEAHTLQPQTGNRPRGKIEVLPNAIQSIAVQATTLCYGVLGLASPRLRNGEAVRLDAKQANQGVRVNVVNGQLIIDVYVVLEYGLRISEIGHNIMSTVKFSIEKMLGIQVAEVNVNVQGLLHSPDSQPEQA
ncbi:putative alkaline shock family protein YloU [Thermosporothrix hazakensis]|jgi:uncharacterized alkaline shock family protein YloU|uniref:Asp23/Gls24 family envelope stress response protein n=2 Tax=Thermosporothrix TaxID=768650 RepID=A0A455SSQ9_9CHLR|nr:Asp23/Gls24 family envelope stress response protein [Thermosporothrix hazakensis]PZW22587.1 putative alkaline shock family protein YloU [Thermosporothrix hazakensis]BBH90508.1 Asp23/Gls24 family envelope stress response protein [Thermosporothrix sp. COM3]GCE48559.1 Asp23/Gls24 family envelope stress response protein [Thermosporothrix hazakensis]